jgi:hypothetical protein
MGSHALISPTAGSGHHHRDLPAYQQLYGNRHATLPGVQRLSSTLVMKNVVENRPRPYKDRRGPTPHGLGVMRRTTTHRASRRGPLWQRPPPYS